MFPSNGLITRRPASLPRVLDGASSPASTVLSGRYDFLPPVPPRFVSFAWRYHSQRSRFARTRPSAAAGGSPGVGHPVSPAGTLVSGNDRISYVPGEPRLCSCPALRPRQDRRIRPLRCAGAAPAVSTTKAPALRTFEAQSHGFGTGCLRFAGRVTPPPRKTRFRLLARLFRTGLVTRRVPSKGFTMYPTSHPPFPSSTWRKDTHT